MDAALLMQLTFAVAVLGLLVARPTVTVRVVLPRQLVRELARALKEGRA